MSEDMPLVSILIPNYNGCEFLDDCLESALGQSYQNIEVIVVDDGSTDKSKEVLLKYENQIRIISTSNRGAAAARNRGIFKAKGEFIAFLDSDDTWTANKISLQMEKMLDDGCDLVYCSGSLMDRSGKRGSIIRARYSGDCYSYFKKFPTRAIIVLGCSGAMIRSSLLKITGNFDESFPGAAEDWDFFRRFCKHGIVGFVPEALINYRRHEKSITQRPLTDWYDGNAKAIRKMIAEDPKIRFLESRNIWTKFQLVALKTFFRNRDVRLTCRSFLAIFLPSNHLPDKENSKVTIHSGTIKKNRG
jgi:glycosyltransferase involved in cell wall biosynthesis